MIKIGITGGIGSGKSTVCRLFSAKGIAVYDSDSEAKRLMVSDADLRQKIQEHFGEEVYDKGELNRQVLAQKIFGDEQARLLLNSLVHPVVRADFARWVKEQTSPYVILESAILFDAQLERILNHTLAVLAPESLRIERAAKRDGVESEKIRQRMAAQMSDDELAKRADTVMVNIVEDDLQPEVDHLDKVFRHMAQTESVTN